jgi:hypothetical protein
MLKGIGATGTTKTNRKGWPQALTLAKDGPERGDIHWRMHASNLLAAVTWFDNKPVSLLSTAFSPIDMNDDVFVRRWHKIAEKSIPSSPILVHYQAHMRGVDVADQLRGYHMVQNKDHKWWHCLFMHTLDTSLVNSWVMYRSNMQEKGEKKLYPIGIQLCDSKETNVVC